MNARRHSTWLMIASLSIGAGSLFVRAADEAPTGGAKPQAKPPAPRPAAPATKPKSATATTRPVKELSADEMFNQLLKAPQQTGRNALSPLPTPSSGGADKSSGPGAVAPG